MASSDACAGTVPIQEAADFVGPFLLIVQHLLALRPGLEQVLPFVCSDMVCLYIAGCPSAPVLTAQQEGWEPPMLF